MTILVIPAVVVAALNALGFHVVAGMTAMQVLTVIASATGLSSSLASLGTISGAYASAILSKACANYVGNPGAGLGTALARAISSTSPRG